MVAIGQSQEDWARIIELYHLLVIQNTFQGLRFLIYTSKESDEIILIIEEKLQIEKEYAQIIIVV